MIGPHAPSGDEETEANMDAEFSSNPYRQTHCTETLTVHCGELKDHVGKPHRGPVEPGRPGDVTWTTDPFKVLNVEVHRSLMGGNFVDIVFDGPPSHESGRFVESEDGVGNSINAGSWIDRGDGFWALRIPLVVTGEPVLMAPDHPNGWKSEDLFPVLIRELEAKQGRETHPETHFIIDHLRKALRWQLKWAVKQGHVTDEEARNALATVETTPSGVDNDENTVDADSPDQPQGDPAREATALELLTELHRWCKSYDCYFEVFQPGDDENEVMDLMKRVETVVG